MWRILPAAEYELWLKKFLPQLFMQKIPLKPGEVKAQCEGGKLEGGCSADASCQGSCNASASAKAECTPPSVAIVAKANGNLDAEGDVQYQTAIASLEANLPKILIVLKARGTAFADSIQAAVKAGVDITGSGKLNAKGAVCGLLISDTIKTSSENFAASLSAAGTVTGSMKLN